MSTQILQCKCGVTQGLIDTDGHATCGACYNAVIEAKNLAVNELFEARQRIMQLEAELCQLKQGS